MSEMIKERPILFSTEMVKAILREDNPKTQTRRVVKFPRPDKWLDDLKSAYQDGGGNWVFWEHDEPGLAEFTKRAYPNGEGIPCPYGRPGDRLWVKETFWIEHDSDTPEFGRAFDCGINIKEDSWTRVQYCATPENPDQPHQAGDWWPHFNQDGPTDEEPKEWVEWQFYSKKPSIFMPRWASRITLEITDVRVERLQAISEEDALAEGINSTWKHASWLDDSRIWQPHTPITWLAGLWDSINAKRGYGWDTNPWVWCITFKRLTNA